MATIDIHRRAEAKRDASLEQQTGWWGLGMVAAIVSNVVLSLALGGIPETWTATAKAEIGQFLTDSTNLGRARVLFAFSNLIFVFGIGFFAGLRHLSDRFDPSGWTKGAVTIGAALFLCGGLVSETLHTGVAVAIGSTPGYDIDANSLLLLQSLWPLALAQGQVGLGVAVVASSLAGRHAGALPSWLVALGLTAGVLAVVRPVLVSQVPLFIGLFVPMFIWIGAFGAHLVRRSAGHVDRSTPDDDVVAVTA